MTDKEKLVELIKKFVPTVWYEDCDEIRHEKCDEIHCSECIAERLIAHGVTVQEWISVKDRLPETAERVLVCKTWNGRVYKPEYGYYQDFPNSKGCWYVLTEFGYYPQREVTHWMPLPPAPKGE